MVERERRAVITPKNDHQDNSESTLNAEPMLNTDANEPTEPIEKADPTEPIERKELRLPMQRIELLDL